jgi:hypothetical protein
MNSKRTNKFELRIQELTKPLNGQYPRPWMTDLKNPMSADVFIVGKNQAKTYDASRLTHKRHLNALFNRNGESCRGLYDEMKNHKPSFTRNNIDEFRKLLERQGVCNVLETNVICYSTPMSEDLKRSGNKGGSARGTEIFENLLRYIRPRVIIVHGAGAATALGRVLGSLPDVPKDPRQVVSTRDAEGTIFVIPSLAPPEWNKWSQWAEPYQTKVAKAVAKELATPTDQPDRDVERNIEVKNKKRH